MNGENEERSGDEAWTKKQLGSYPERDFTANAARQLEPMLERFHVPHDIKIYPGARRSFFNDRGPVYQAEAAADAWARTLAFFDTHIRNPELNRQRQSKGNIR